MPKLTESRIRAALATGKPFNLTDTEVAGLQLRRQSPTGATTWALQYRDGERVRRVRLGRHPTLVLAQARRAARELHGERAAGRDPAEARAVARAAPMVADLLDAYVGRHLPKLAPRTQRDARDTIARELRPRFGKRKAAELTRAHVARWHAGMSDRPVAANRALALLSGVYAQGEAWGLVAANPCHGVRRFPEQARERFLTTAEWQRLLDALDAEAERFPLGVAAIRLLALTGARKSEILRARWEQIDFEHRTLVLPRGKTGRRTIRLSTEALDVLGGLREQVAGAPWVFPSQLKRDAPLEDLRKPWAAVKKRAGLGSLRLHDLRHSAAERLIRSGASLRVVGEVLGHRKSDTTRRYAHVAADVAAEAVERLGDDLAAVRRAPAEIRDLRQ